MYLKFTIGKEKQLINYTNGVSQGDNALPFLFLFLMMVATGSFRSVFQLEEKHIFHYFPDHKHPDKQKGRLKEQSTKAEGQTFEVSNVLYVVDDDGAFFCCTQRNYPEAYTFTLRNLVIKCTLVKQ
jgi:hypothetical protein